MRHCKCDIHLSANEPELSCASLDIWITTPAEVEDGCGSSIISMEMDKAALELRCPCSEGSHCIHSLEVTDGVVFSNQWGWKLYVIGLLPAYGACFSATGIHEEGDGWSAVYMHHIHSISGWKICTKQVDALRVSSMW